MSRTVPMTRVISDIDAERYRHLLTVLDYQSLNNLAVALAYGAVFGTDPLGRQMAAEVLPLVHDEAVCRPEEKRAARQRVVWQVMAWLLRRARHGRNWLMAELPADAELRPGAVLPYVNTHLHAFTPDVAFDAFKGFSSRAAAGGHRLVLMEEK